MSTERDELAMTLRQKFHGWMGPAVSYDLADEVIAAGYRKSRTITTIGNLSSEPEGTVIHTAHGLLLQRNGHYWNRPGSYTDYGPIIDWLPATVLHEPEAAK